jgi:membrane protein implicated in regulation of membrane protease activity
MSQRNFSQGVPGNPIVQIAAFLVAILIAIGAVFLGAVVLSFFVGFAIIGWIILTIRVWWLRRRMQPDSRMRRGSQSGEIVEVEYTVVEERPVNNPQDRDSS